jgi:tetratricopeptide (TPR) repeat protein
MTLSAIDLAQAFENLWTRIELILEWEPGFGIFFVFSSNDHAAKDLRQRVEDATRLRTGLLQWVRPDDPETVREAVIQAAFPEPGSEDYRYHEWRAPLWVELTDSPGDPVWQTARRTVLAVLNRIRSALENRCPRPFFLQLPEAMAPEVADYAPDLWSVRQFVAVLPAVTMQSSGVSLSHTRKISTRPLSGKQLLRQLRAGLNDTAKNARRLAKSLQNAGLSHVDAVRLKTAIAAYHDALPQLFDLREDLVESERKSRDVPHTDSPPAETARAARENTLAQYETFVKTIGDAPQILRETFASLRTLGNKQATGQRDAAQTAFRHAGQLASALLLWRDSLQKLEDTRFAHFSATVLQNLFAQRTRLGDIQQALRDISVSLGKLGDAEREAGNLTHALEAYRKSLALAEQLRARLGDTPQTLRDISFSLGRLGDAEREAGNLTHALDAYRKSLELREQLRTRLGDTPQALNDLKLIRTKILALGIRLGSPSVPADTAS